MNDRFFYTKKILDIGVKYTKLSMMNYDNWATYVCDVLNILVGDDIYSTIIDADASRPTIITIKNRNSKVINNENGDSIVDILDFLNNEILLFKLENLK